MENMTYEIRLKDIMQFALEKQAEFAADYEIVDFDTGLLHNALSIQKKHNGKIDRIREISHPYLNYDWLDVVINKDDEGYVYFFAYKLMQVDDICLYLEYLLKNEYRKNKKKFMDFLNKYVASNYLTFINSETNYYVNSKIEQWIERKKSTKFSFYNYGVSFWYIIDSEKLSHGEIGKRIEELIYEFEVPTTKQVVENNRSFFMRPHGSRYLLKDSDYDNIYYLLKDYKKAQAKFVENWNNNQHPVHSKREMYKVSMEK